MAGDKIKQCLDWLEHNSNDQKAKILDCRNREAFHLNHLKNSVNIPVAEIKLRTAELPVKNCPLILVGSASELTHCRKFLLKRGYKIIRELEVNLPDFWITLRENPHLKKLWSNKNSSNQLWQPNLFLKNNFLQIEKLLSIGHPPRVLDIGCGSGREAVYLARKGWQITAVDHLEDACNRCQQLAQFQLTEQKNIQIICADITASDSLFDEASFDLIMTFRFLHRPLFKFIQCWLKPGGIFIAETFAIEAAKFGKPRRHQFMLKKDELSSFFPDWNILHQQQRQLSDGRPLTGGIYQKPLL